MSDWTEDQLERIGGTTELEIAPRRAEGSLRHFTTIWVVRVGSGLYVRSWQGPNGSWFTTANKTAAGRIRAGGNERDITFERAGDVDRDAIDSAYRAKYGRSGYVDAMVSDTTAATTLRLVPR